MKSRGQRQPSTLQDRSLSDWGRVPIPWQHCRLALRAPPCKSLEATRGSKSALHQGVPQGTLLLLVHLGVQPLATQFVVQPLRAELNSTVQQTLQI